MDNTNALDGYTFRDPQQAFSDAIALGALTTLEGCYTYAGNFMYMHTENGMDTFKNIHTRRSYTVTQLLLGAI